MIAGLARTFAKIYRDKDLAVELAIPPDLRFRGERQDLEEMAGNLIDNAAKWAARKVGGRRRDRAARTTGRASACSSTTTGRACRRAARAEMLKRGRRLDETKPGSGLGLSIVSDLAALYRGSLRLDAVAPRAACGRCWNSRGTEAASYGRFTRDTVPPSCLTGDAE